MIRILVTGSRDWEDWNTVRKAFIDVAHEFGHPLTIVHGGQVTKRWRTGRTGADYIADELARQMGAKVEVHPVSNEDWHRFGRGAGPQRNQRMVDAGAAVCLAFPMGVSKGTRDCMRRAEAAGIPVRNYGDGDSR